MTFPIQPRAHFSCTGPDCGKTFDLNTVIYTCDVCGELLQVTHDLKELQKIEVEGLDQSGLEGTLKKITSNKDGSTAWIFNDEEAVQKFHDEGLKYLKSKGIKHGNLKLENYLIDDTL